MIVGLEDQSPVFCLIFLWANTENDGVWAAYPLLIE